LAWPTNPLSQLTTSHGGRALDAHEIDEYAIRGVGWPKPRSTSIEPARRALSTVDESLD
jgi:hypothetical protein